MNPSWDGILITWIPDQKIENATISDWKIKLEQIQLLVSNLDFLEYAGQDLAFPEYRWSFQFLTISQKTGFSKN